MSSVKKLVIVSHVRHYEYEGKIYAYGPYTREIDIWADLFPQVLIASPCRQGLPPGDCLSFTRPNIAMAPQLDTGGDNLSAKIKQCLLLPAIVVRLMRAMAQGDAIHVRCPGNLGLLGCLLAPLLTRRRIAKFAGQWNGYRGETRTVRWQRALLRSNWWRAPVTVYGNWPNQPEHIIPFFTSMMTGEQVHHAAQFAAGKQLHQPLRVLFSGRLAPEKRVSALVEALALADRAGLAFEAAFVGDGIERPRIEQQLRELHLTDKVQLVGAVPFDEGLRWNEWADCLVLPSKNSEGWPKVIAEAMCYGLVCVGVDHGQVGCMLENRGVLLADGSPPEIADALSKIAADPEGFRQKSQLAADWSRRYSIDGLRDALRDLLVRQWDVKLRHIRPAPPVPAALPTAVPATSPSGGRTKTLTSSSGM